MHTTDLKKSHDIAVFIGRFEPLHRGHVAIINEGLRQAHTLVVLIGSANEPRSFRNPFTAQERALMIRNTFNNDPRLVIVPLEDSSYNLNDWLERVNKEVDAIAQRVGLEKNISNPSVALIGHAKDATSYYLNLFPHWASINVPQKHTVAATDMRKRLFGDESLGAQILDSRKEDEDPMKTSRYLETYVETAKTEAARFLNEEAQRTSESILPQPVINLLNTFIVSPAYDEVAREYAFVAKYRHAWRDSPYEPTFLTTDAVVIQSGHVLLVKRKSYPGKGLWALPGGFVETNETLLDGCLRELHEETGLRVNKEVLYDKLVTREVYDNPHRSSRGRTVTHAFLFQLPPGKLPKIKTGGQKGDEETQKIAWVPLSRLKRERFFEDHYSIISHLTSRL